MRVSELISLILDDDEPAKSGFLWHGIDGHYKIKGINEPFTVKDYKNDNTRRDWVKLIVYWKSHIKDIKEQVEKANGHIIEYYATSNPFKDCYIEADNLLGWYAEEPPFIGDKK